MNKARLAINRMKSQEICRDMLQSFSLPYKRTFTKREIATMKWLATARGAHKANWGERFVKSTDLTPADIVSARSHYQGMCGEYMVAEMTGGFFDPLPRFLGDKDKSDIIVGGSGMKIAVKTAQHNPPHFKLTKMKEIEDATHLALCLYKEPEGQVIWIKEKQEFLENYFVKSYGYGLRYCLA